MESGKSLKFVGLKKRKESTTSLNSACSKVPVTRTLTRTTQTPLAVQIEIPPLTPEPVEANQ